MYEFAAGMIDWLRGWLRWALLLPMRVIYNWKLIEGLKKLCFRVAQRYECLRWGHLASTLAAVPQVGCSFNCSLASPCWVGQDAEYWDAKRASIQGGIIGAE